jgi:hypothetical protein
VALQSITFDQVLANPLPCILLFSVYFLAAIGVLLGTAKDSRSAPLRETRIAHMKQFLTFKEVPQKPSTVVKAVRHLFLITNALLALLSVAILLVGATNVSGMVHWLFGTTGITLLVVYASFQLWMCALGPFLVGSISNTGSLKRQCVLWFALATVAYFMNLKGMELYYQGDITFPFYGSEVPSFHHIVIPSFLPSFLPLSHSFLPSAKPFLSSNHPFLTSFLQTIQDVVNIIGRFWTAAKPKERSLILEKLPSNTACHLHVFNDENEGDATARECANELMQHIDMYLVVMAGNHLWLLSLYIPSGMWACMHWHLWRQRTQHAALVSWASAQALATEINDAIPAPQEIASKAVAATSEVLNAEVNQRSQRSQRKATEELNEMIKKDISHKERAKLASQYSFHAGFVALAQKHRFLSILLKTQLEFPRADRVLCLMAFTLSNLYAAAIFRTQATLLNPEWECVPTSFGISHTCGGTDVNDVCRAASVDWCKSHCGTAESLVDHCGLEEDCFCIRDHHVECADEDNCLNAFHFIPTEDMSKDVYCICDETIPGPLFTIAHTLFIVVFSTIPVAIMIMFFTKGHRRLIASDKIAISSKVLRLTIKVEALAEQGIFFRGNPSGKSRGSSRYSSYHRHQLPS